MSERIDDTGADAKTSERTGARHEFDFGDILPGLVVFCEFIANKF